jgi:hypothetical protein
VLQIWEDEKGEYASLEEARQEAKGRGYTYVLDTYDEWREHPAASHPNILDLVEQRVTKEAGIYAPMWAEDFLYGSHTDLSLARALRIKADSSDEELEAMIEGILSEARVEVRAILCGDVLEILQRVREAVREHEREESEEESE